MPFFVEYRDPSTGEERNREGEGDVDGDHDDDGRTTKGPTFARGGGGKGWRRRRTGGEDDDADRSSRGVVVVLPPPSSSSSSSGIAFVYYLPCVKLWVYYSSNNIKFILVSTQLFITIRRRLFGISTTSSSSPEPKSGDGTDG